jgi:hypothetical protein
MKSSKKSIYEFSNRFYNKIINVSNLIAKNNFKLNSFLDYLIKFKNEWKMNLNKILMII